MADKLNLHLGVDPGQCSIKSEPKTRVAAGKCPRSFCRMRAHAWGNAAGWMNWIVNKMLPSRHQPLNYPDMLI